MEENKLTDEKIVKALKCTAGIMQVDCDYCPFLINKFCSDTQLATATLDLIKHLQAENAEYERKLEDGEVCSMDWHDEQVLHANEEIENMQAVIFGLEEEKRQLQIKVDALKERCEIAEGTKHRLTIFDRMEIYSKAVKDTAKEICDLILEHWEKGELIECDWLRVAISERYGLEVE